MKKRNMKKTQEKQIRSLARNYGQQNKQNGQVARPSAPKNPVAYDPFASTPSTKGTFSLAYDPLASQKQADLSMLQSFENMHKKKQTPSVRRKAIQQEMRRERLQYEDRMEKMEDQLPSHLKHMPRKLPSMIQKMDTTIKHRISKFEMLSFLLTLIQSTKIKLMIQEGRTRRG